MPAQQENCQHLHCRTNECSSAVQNSACMLFYACARCSEGTPEGHTGKVCKVLDVLSFCEASHVVKPQRLHKVVQCQGNLQAVPAHISRVTSAWRESILFLPDGSA